MTSIWLRNQLTHEATQGFAPAKADLEYPAKLLPSAGAPGGAPGGSEAGPPKGGGDGLALEAWCRVLPRTLATLSLLYCPPRRLFLTLLLSSLELSDRKVYEPSIRALLEPRHLNCDLSIGEEWSPNPESKTWNPKPETRNPEPGTRNPEPGTWNLKPGARNPEPGTRNSKPGTRNLEPETRSLEPRTRDPEPETWSPESGTRNPEPETWNLTLPQLYLFPWSPNPEPETRPCTGVPRTHETPPS